MGREGTRSSSDWSNSLVLSHACWMPPVLLHPVVPQPRALHFPSFFNCFKFKIEMTSVIKAGSTVNLLVEEVPSNVQYLPLFVLHWPF